VKAEETILAERPSTAVEPAPWWKTEVVYHIYPRSFADSNGDGVGDLRGIIERLDYLNDGTRGSLGVNAIWLSPIYLSPGRDGGYDVADHTSIAPTYGTLEDFDLLVDEARRRGIHGVIDLVLNHTSDLHPWFLESRSSSSSPYSDWYIWRSPRVGRRTPNNWRSFFGGSAWTFDAEREQYYLHTFLPEQPDLNWHHPDVRGAAGEIIDFWIERGVSGFRLDVFNAYFKHPELLDNPRRAARSAWRRPRHLYNKDRPELRGADRLQHAIARWDTLLAHERTWPSYVLSNHDNPRHASRLSPRLPRRERDARAKVAAAMLLTLRGTPFVYYGEEIGMNDATIPADVYLRSHETQSVLVALNLTKVTQRLRLDSEAPTRRWVPRLSTRRPDVGWSVILGRELTLGPYEATIFEATRPAT
jgi:alpha-glucosidase